MNYQPMVARIAQQCEDANGIVWPAQTLREAAPKFNGAKVFFRHRHDRVGTQPLGFIKEVGFFGDDDSGYLAGLFVPWDGRLAMHLQEAARKGLSPGLSLSIDGNIVRLKSHPNTPVVLDISKVNSVDVVDTPAIAGSRIITEVTGAPIAVGDPRMISMLEGRPDSAALSQATAYIFESGVFADKVADIVTNALAGYRVLRPRAAMALRESSGRVLGPVA